LLRFVRKMTRLSSHGYITLMRLKRAAQLIEMEAGSISEIAGMVGFRDPGHFSRLFRNTFGYPPSAHRADSSVSPMDGDADGSDTPPVPDSP